MALLIDQIRERGVFFSPVTDGNIDVEFVRELSSSLLHDDLDVFDVTGAVDAYYDHQFDLTDIPSFRLPYDHCWIEARDIADYNRNPTMLTRDWRWGALMHQIDRTRDAFLNMEGKRLEMDDDCVYAQAGTLYVHWREQDNRKLPVHGPLCTWAIGMKADGNLDFIDGQPDTIKIHLTILSEPVYEYVQDWWQFRAAEDVSGYPLDHQAKLFLCWQFIMPLYAGIGVLNMRNVYAEKQPIAEKLQAARVKRKKPRFMQYHTLVVKPFGTKIKEPYEFGKRPTYKGVMPLHKVRGHAKHFTEDHPRFGRASDGIGVFWVDAFWQGNREVGEIKKDYALEAGDGPDRTIVRSYKEVETMSTPQPVAQEQRVPIKITIPVRRRRQRKGRKGQRR